MNMYLDSDMNSNFGRSALFTDFYELTMAQAYMVEGMTDTAVFELAFRKLPAARNFVLACGLESVLQWLGAFRFTDTDLEYLASLNRFSGTFLQRLATLRFTGDVYAIPEGTAVFPNEPVVQVIAPIIEAQLAETWILNQVHCASVFASKAARIVTAAQGRAVIDFGARRGHGSDAALQLARASYIAGAAATSNVEAGRCYGIPVDGTMAHSYIQAHDDEREAFRRFVREFSGTTVLVDTYDTLAAVRKLIELIAESNGELTIGAVRLDSGDLDALSRETRRLLDEAGLRQVKIIASSGLDEHKIEALVRAQAPVDGFGVGTHLAVSSDAPELDFAYKLVAYAGRPRMKTASDKLILPGRKQVFRRWRDGRMAGDVIAGFDEQHEGEPLLQPVMRGGRRLDRSPQGAVDAAGWQRERRERLEAIRAHARAQLDGLPPTIRDLAKATPGYPVEVSAPLTAAQQALRARLARDSNHDD